ncbi:uncharacterized protein PGTG_05894 [Puccinia graminis f. sp. tritici CRL 75-36-700-3]|uniref:CCHC-type domain-containing protein n=1 Tax=Puccinia graminis f. sp. tritici (strain CRL 75-36-700-3 / race SCCL) TaxID=418459 RepID=E3K602_PUCGT|nr:uncharacterized protein PGTG_05894 [Puccinia graminis f. sp. tritici CRL 75-36-700-3]EFP79573.1 hypothetical protein PGTG_05894 [Puccinia graminis f. sp. tritici CRL 75-36-700-3]
MNNPSALIQTVPTLDGNSVTFTSWRNRLQNVLQIQGVLDIVNKAPPRPNNADSKEGKLAVRSPEQRGYNPEDYGADWVRHGMLNYPNDIVIGSRYTIRNGKARHQPIAKWIAWLRMAASDLASVKLTPSDQQICDRLIRGLDDSWKTIRDHLAYSPNKISLDDAVGALESHEISTNTPLDHSDQLQSASAAVKGKGRPRCYTCGEKGHHSAECPKKKSFKSSSKSAEARAGATAVAHLGN